MLLYRFPFPDRLPLTNRISSSWSPSFPFPHPRNPHFVRSLRHSEVGRGPRLSLSCGCRKDSGSPGPFPSPLTCQYRISCTGTGLLPCRDLPSQASASLPGGSPARPIQYHLQRLPEFLLRLDEWERLRPHNPAEALDASDLWVNLHPVKNGRVFPDLQLVEALQSVCRGVHVSI